MGRRVSPIAWMSIEENEVPFVRDRGTRDKTASDEAVETGAMKWLGSTGKAVRFVCFFKILRVASEVANWN